MITIRNDSFFLMVIDRLGGGVVGFGVSAQLLKEGGGIQGGASCFCRYKGVPSCRQATEDGIYDFTKGGISRSFKGFCACPNVNLNVRF